MRQGAAWLVLNQLVARGLTFALNALIVRSLDPEVYGIANVRLQLVLATSVALIRDTGRQACARLADVPQQAVNLAWLTPVLVVLLAALIVSTDELGYARAHSAGYRAALALFCASSALEALAEPAYVHVQARMLWSVRALVEGGAHAARCVLTYALLARCADARSSSCALRALALAQLGYAALYSAAYHAHLALRVRARTLPARAGEGEAWLSPRTWPLVRAYAVQQAAKFVLTHGETVLLLREATAAEQGVFALVANLGSLLARLVFEPAEEAVFAHLSQRAARHADADAPARAGRGASDAPAPSAETARRLADTARRLLQLGLVVGAFGPPYARLLLAILYGRRWSDGPAAALLGSYSAHVPLMALNGVLEAAVRALGSAEHLAMFNAYLGACALLYWAGLVLLFRAGWGLHAVVLANALNLGARAAHHIWRLSALMQRAPADSAAGGARASWAATLLPSAGVWLMLAAAALATHVSVLAHDGPGRTLADSAAHVAIGAVNFAVVASTLLRVELAPGEALLPLLRRLAASRRRARGGVPGGGAAEHPPREKQA